MGAENPAKNEIQPLRKAQPGPHASLRYAYSPPARGMFMPNSAYAKQPARATIPPTTQMPRTNSGRPKSPARNPVVVKMPVPIMFDTTRAAQLVTVRTRRRGAVISYRRKNART